MKQFISVLLIQTLAVLVITLVYLWPDQLLIFGFDVPYLLIADCRELEQYYPDFYWLIYGLAQFIKFGLPVIALSLMFIGLTDSKRRIEKPLGSTSGETAEMVRSILLPFMITLALVVLSYYVLQEHMNDRVHFQRSLARSFLLVNCFNLLLTRLRFSELTDALVKQFLIVQTWPYALAITRVLFFGYSLLIYDGFSSKYGPFIGSLEKVALPGIGWFMEVLPVNPTIYSWVCFSGIVFAFMVVVGYRTRLFLILNGLSIFYVLATPNFFGKLWHYQIVIWISWILAASPCADVWSLDAKLGRVRTVDTNSGYGFHLRMIWLHFGMIYFFAGFHKLWVSGFDWALADTVVNLISVEWFEHYDKIAWPRVDRFPILVKAGALVTIVFELFYLFLLLSRRWRWLAIGGGLLMHNLLGHFMYIAFFGMLQVFYVVYIPWNWILEKLNLLKEVDLPKITRPRWLSPALSIPIFIFCMNLLCGVFQINSYPFSVYPVYTDVVADTVAYFDYRVLDRGKEDLDFREEGKRHHFRWENYSRMEYEIIKHYRQEYILDTAAVRTMWRRWQLEVPPLAEVDSVQVFVKYRYVSPDSNRVPLPPQYLLTIVD